MRPGWNGVVGVRSLRGHLPAVSVLPAAGRGNSRLWAVPELGGELRRSPEDPLPLLCSPAHPLDLSLALPLGLFPSVPHAAARGRSGVPELESSVPGLVSAGARLVLPRKAWTGPAEHQESDQRSRESKTPPLTQPV